MKKRRNYKKVKMSDYKRIFRLYFEDNYSLREIERILNIPKSTLNDYLNRIQKSKVTYEALKDLSDSEIQRLIFPVKESVKDTSRIPDFKIIEKEMSIPHVTFALLYEELLQANPNLYSYSHCSKLYKKWCQSKKLVMRQKHNPGEKVFIDYAGKGFYIRDRVSGQDMKHQLFVTCLALSGYIYAECSKSQRSIDFCSSIVNSLNYFKGAPRLFVPDNLKAGVISSGYYDPSFNTSFQELADYYGVSICSTRTRKPKDKAKVENSVLLAEHWILAKLRHMIFYSISEANTYILILLDQLNQKIMRQYGKSRKEMYLEYDLPYLKALPKEHFIPRICQKYKVPHDYHISYKHNHYSVPYQYVKQEVLAIISNKQIEIYHERKLISKHLLSYGFNEKLTLSEHMPEHHRQVYFNETVTEESLMIRAEKIGKETYGLIQEILSNTAHPVYRLRRCLGILKTAERLQIDEAEKASALFMTLEIKKISVYRNIVKSRIFLQENSDQNLPEKCTMNHHNLRGKENYQ